MTLLLLLGGSGCVRWRRPWGRLRACGSSLLLGRAALLLRQTPRGLFRRWLLLLLLLCAPCLGSVVGRKARAGGLVHVAVKV